MEKKSVGLVGALVWPGFRGLLAGLVAAGIYYLILEGAGPPIPAVVAGIGVFIIDAHRVRPSA